MDADTKYRQQIKQYLDQGHTAKKDGNDALLSQPTPSIKQDTSWLGLTKRSKVPNVIISYGTPIRLKEKCVYRTLDRDVFEIVELKFHDDDVDTMMIKIVSAFDEPHTLVFPRSNINFNAITHEGLKPYLGTIHFLEKIELLYDSLDNKAHDSIDITSGIRDSCPKDLQDVRAELATLKKNVVTGNVNKLDLVPLSMTANTDGVQISAIVGSKRVELNIRNNDTIATQVPFISNAFQFGMQAADKNRNELKTIKCKVIHINHEAKPKAEVLLEIKGTNKRFTVSVDPTLYFWKHISVLDKFLGDFKKYNIHKQMTRKGGYTSKTLSFLPKKVKKMSKRTAR